MSAPTPEPSDADRTILDRCELHIPRPADQRRFGAAHHLRLPPESSATPLNAIHDGNATHLFEPQQHGAETPGSPKQTAPTTGARYLVGREIGRGGVGIIFEGWDTQLQREVAIKVLQEEHRKKPHVVQRFLQEAYINGRLQHPGIIAIHELGVSADDRPFFVMRLVRGDTLAHILSQREDLISDLPKLLGIFHRICQTVAYVHSQGVIHRDLKPSNIMVGPFGVIKVMDWGLAKELETRNPLDGHFAETHFEYQGGTNLETDLLPQETQVGTVLGTPAYLPPEQARGEIERIDRRADVFELGGILCQILTGRPPYVGANSEEIYKKAATADIAETHERLNQCPVALDLISLTKWCLQPNPCDRPADASHLVEILTAQLEVSQRRAELDLVRFFDLTLDLFCIASTKGYFIRVNENFPRVLGYTSTELTSRPFLEFVHPEDRDRTGHEVVRVASGASCIQFTNRYRHAKGYYVWLEWSAQTVSEEGLIYAVARDVSNRVTRNDAVRVAGGMHRPDEISTPRDWTPGCE